MTSTSVNPDSSVKSTRSMISVSTRLNTYIRSGVPSNTKQTLQCLFFDHALLAQNELNCNNFFCKRCSTSWCTIDKEDVIAIGSILLDLLHLEKLHLQLSYRTGSNVVMCWRVDTSVTVDTMSCTKNDRFYHWSINGSTEKLDFKLIINSVRKSVFLCIMGVTRIGQ